MDQILINVHETDQAPFIGLCDNPGINMPAIIHKGTRIDTYSLSSDDFNLLQLGMPGGYALFKTVDFKGYIFQPIKAWRNVVNFGYPY